MYPADERNTSRLKGSINTSKREHVIKGQFERLSKEMSVLGI
jgi:hypothetical protein